jgi:hypothetical protein
MKKLICILAGAALLGACEQKTEVVAPAPVPDKPDAAATGQRPKRDAASLSKAGTPSAITGEAKAEPVDAAAAATTTTETKTESTESTITLSTPAP